MLGGLEMASPGRKSAMRKVSTAISSHTDIVFNKENNK